MLKSAYDSECLFAAMASESQNALLLKPTLTAIFYAICTIHYEYMQEEQTVNGKFYKELVDCSSLCWA
jgi:hypothetical protein